MSVEKVRPKQAHQDVQRSDALLVCAYDSQEKFESNHLRDAMPLNELRSIEASLSNERELIFYCAWPNDESSSGRAIEYEEKGFDNAKALEGGVKAWKSEGLPVDWGI